jgi:hypothetical protein
VTDAGEAQTLPRPALTHARQKVPQGQLDLVLQTDEAPNRVVDSEGEFSALTADTVDFFEHCARFTEVFAIQTDIAQEGPPLALALVGELSVLLAGPRPNGVVPRQEIRRSRSPVCDEVVDELSRGSLSSADRAVQVPCLFDHRDDRSRNGKADRDIVIAPIALRGRSRVGTA